MSPLFPSTLLQLEEVGQLTANLELEKESISDQPVHSWDFDENFPNQVGPKDSTESISNEYTFTTAIMAFSDTLLIIVKENFLKVSPIVVNQVSKELVKLLSRTNSNVSIIVLGTSDQLLELKPISNTFCSLQPPEFVTGFVGSVLSQLVTASLPFEGFIAPSEGPVGFEKMTLETMENLVEAFNKWIPVGVLNYADECYRRWRLDGCASGAQSGLYI